MNLIRAKEHFSAYREGTLDAALRMAFERALQTDTELQAEYRAFDLAMDDLDSLREEEIEPPMWLSDRIATRLDEAQAGRSKTPIWWTGWFRNLAFGGLAVAAIGGAIVGVISRGGNTATGSIIPTPAPSVTTPRLQYKLDGDRLSITSTGEATATSGEVSSRFGGNLKGELRNPNANPAAFSIQVDGKEQEIVVMPGTDRKPNLTGEGSLVDFAKALATDSGRPVRLPAEKKNARASWDYSEKDALSDANEALKSIGMGADQRESGEIVLSTG
ncbi:hypothetical protein BH11ARM2_BH11ARM2_32550 [soil metagenome]